MKKLQYMLLLALLSSGCVKHDWDKPEVRTIPAPDKFVTSLNENFNTISLVDGQSLLMPQGWCNTGRNGWHRAFQTSIVTNNAGKVVQCATASAYLALGDTTDAWLITPPLKIRDGAAFTYTAALGYNQNDRAIVEVRSYSTSSASATVPSLSNLNEWTPIDTLSAKPPYSITSGSGAVTWFQFYQQRHTLSSYKSAPTDDVIYVAFRYLIRKPAVGSNSWYFDDIKYNN